MADTIAPAGMPFVPPQSTINSHRFSFFVNTIFLWNTLPCDILTLSTPKFRQALLCYFNKTRASVLFLRFPYFELRNIYKQFRIRVRIPITAQYTVVDSFIDIEAGLVLSMWFVLAVMYLTLERSGL